MLRKFWAWVHAVARRRLVAYDAGLPAEEASLVRELAAYKEVEAELRATAEKFGQAFHASPFAAAILTIDDEQFLDVNSGFARLTGYAVDEVLGRNMTDLGLWHSGAAPDSFIQQLLPGGGNASEVQMRRRDGTYRNVVLTSVPINVHGEERLLIIGQDVTKSRENEAALRASERKFATLFRACPDPIVVTDIATLAIVDVSEAFTELVGYSRDTIRGHSAHDMGIWWSEADRDKFFGTVREQGFARNLALNIRTKAGECRHMQLAAERVNLGGEPHLITVARDVTEQRRAEDAYRSAEARFAAAFHTSPDAIIIAEAETGRIVDVNPAFVRLTRYEQTEVVGKRPSEVGVWREGPERAKVIEGLRAGTSVLNQELPFYTKDGKKRWSEVFGEAIDIEGVPSHVVVARDITDRKAAQEAIRVSEEKFAKAFQASPNAITITSLRTGRLYEVNNSFERLSGFTREEVVGKTSVGLDLWADPAERERFAEMLYLEGTIQGFTTAFQAKTHVGYAEVAAELIELNDELCVLTIIHDITEQKETIEALQRSEEKFARAFQASPDVLALSIVETGELLEVNSVFVEATGYSRAESIGQRAEDLGLWADGNDRLAFTEQLKRDGLVRNFATQVCRRNGERRDAEMSGELLEIDGQLALLLIARDVTEQNHAQAALRESEARYRAVVQTQTELIARNAPDTTVRFANEAYCAYFGVQPEDIIGQSFLKLIHVEDQAALHAHIADLLVNPRTEYQVHRVYDHEGNARWNEWVNQPILDETGRVVEFQSVGRDITPRIEAELALKASEEKFAKAFQASPDSLTLTSMATGQIVEVNEGFEQITGYAAAEVVGKLWTELDLWRDLEQFRDQVTRQNTGEALRNEPTDFISKDGRIIHGLMSTEPIEIGDEPFALAVVRDVTAQHKVEQALRESETQYRTLYSEVEEARSRLESLSRRLVRVQEQERRFVAMELHDEVGQLLTIARLSLETVQLENTEQAQKKLQQALDHLDTLAKSVRNLSLNLRPSMLDDLGLLPTIQWYVRRFSKESGIQVEFSDAGLGRTRFSPELEITAFRIMQEALTNVARYAGTTSATVETALHASMFELIVEDQGKGFFPTEVLARHQTGGLSGIRERATLVGGTVDIQSEPGQGTRVVVSLPL